MLRVRAAYAWKALKLSTLSASAVQSHFARRLTQSLWEPTTSWQKLINWVPPPTSPHPPTPLLLSSPATANCSLIRITVSWCLHVSPTSSQSFNNTKYCASSSPPSSHPLSPPSPLSNWEPLVHAGDPERPVSPWASRPRGSGSPCADSRSVNRADGFWQIHSDWKSFILQDFFLPLFFPPWKPPMHKKSCPSTFGLGSEGLDNLFHGHLRKHLEGFH